MIFSNERKGRRGVKDNPFVKWNYGRRGCGCPTPTHSSFIRNEINPSTPSLVSTIVVSMVPSPHRLPLQRMLLYAGAHGHALYGLHYFLTKFNFLWYPAAHDSLFMSSLFHPENTDLSLLPKLD